jgi:invasion protein IalB
VRRFLACIALSATTVSSAFAQGAKPATPVEPAKQAGSAEPTKLEIPSQGWTVNCSTGTDGLACKVTQSMFVGQPGQAGQLLAAATVFKAIGAAAPYGLTLVMPHGLFLPAGASIQIDADAAQPLPIETCDQRGCYSTVPLPEKTMAAMKTGKVLSITFQNLSKSTVKVQLSLAGFADAVKKL